MKGAAGGTLPLTEGGLGSSTLRVVLWRSYDINGRSLDSTEGPNHRTRSARRRGQLLEWDQQTMMPSGGAPRGTQLATITGMMHDKLSDPAVGCGSPISATPQTRSPGCSAEHRTGPRPRREGTTPRPTAAASNAGFETG